MIEIYIITSKTIANGVKLETSILAMQRKKEMPDGSYKEMLEELVMGEDREILFKRLFLDAKADIVMNMSSNLLAGTPTNLEPIMREYPDFSEELDFHLYLNMHNDWPRQYKNAVHSKLERYLIDYVCWRWLETKSANDAITFQARLSNTLEDIRRLLVRKNNPLQIQPSFP